ncbi:glycoside hydrolase family 43 protein [Bifidobacterium avesanii]|uniref:Family 43 glycosylhydrolase n=1 Tax=Bifidobacterium avesanii TaxID=1798157 RepID=A0A7K3TJC6_9BIFI|nr:glycoside hydrolase family 43 protein [Bifidobacterium avesanii]KAB8289577.1 Bacterial Ig-like domain (group 4) [Bifidobacterium avesanii]NEG79132.1 hypothetical protein [Bifidobacterium avesanii]
MTDAREPYEAYLWVYFTGEGLGGERLSLAVSRGNTALDWITLNHGRPLFESRLGTRGLRDPFILRSHPDDPNVPDGETRFWMIATDLNVHDLPGRFHEAQIRGSRYVEIWESDDLVHWSDQRHVKVNTNLAGNTWAPEAHWIDELGAYAVYWSSNLYDSPSDGPDARPDATYNRLMVATTADFRTFGEPQVWVDVRRDPDGSGFGTIDATVTKHAGVYYRFVKDEATMTIREERSTRFMATVEGSYPGAEGPADAWTLVGDKIGDGSPNGYGGVFDGGEGPSIFPANPGDETGFAWYLFIDQPRYHHGPNHYVPFATRDIADPRGWRCVGDLMPESRMPTNADGGRPRHGTVIPITAAERDRLLAALG